MSDRIEIALLCDDAYLPEEHTNEPFPRISYNESFRECIELGRSRGIELVIGHAGAYQRGGTHPHLWRGTEQGWLPAPGNVRNVFHKIVKGIEYWNELTKNEPLKIWPHPGFQTSLVDKRQHSALHHLVEYAPAVALDHIECGTREDFELAIEHLRQEVKCRNPQDYDCTTFYLKAAISGGAKQVMRLSEKQGTLQLPTGISGPYVLQVAINACVPNIPFDVNKLMITEGERERFRNESHDVRRICIDGKVLQVFFKQQPENVKPEFEGIHGFEQGARTFYVDLEKLPPDFLEIAPRLQNYFTRRFWTPDLLSIFPCTIDGAFSKTGNFIFHEVNTCIGQTYDRKDPVDVHHTRQVMGMYIGALKKVFSP